MLSRFIRFRERDGCVAIFHDLHPVPVYCSTEVWRKISSDEELLTPAEEQIKTELKKQKLIVENIGVDDQEHEYARKMIEHKFSQPTILYLMTAQGCNLDCGYCPIPGIAKKHGESFLSLENAKAGIDLWANHLLDAYDSNLEYFVIFYGGEPLLNKEVIQSSLKYLDSLVKLGILPNINKMIVTNGLLLDSKIISLFKEYDVSVVVGLDGPRDVHNTFRVDNCSKGSFDEVIKGVKLLIKNGIKTSASVSITPANVDKIKYFGPFFKDLGIEKLGFNFVRGKRLLELLGTANPQEFYKKVARAIIENFQVNGEEYLEYQMEKKIQAFTNGYYFPVDCTCYGNQLVIQPDGQISNCPFRKSMMGQVQNVSQDFRIYNHEFVKYLRQRLPLYNKELDVIEEKTLYGGGCSWACEELSGDPLAIDECSLTFTKEVFNELLWTQQKK